MGIIRVGKSRQTATAYFELCGKVPFSFPCLMEFLPWSLVFFDSSQGMEKVRLLNENLTASPRAILHLSE